MNWDIIFADFTEVDLIKIIGSVVAGIILGVEREFKDKSAGLKTITTICLGSTLFTILSYKMGIGESEDATRIASYIVSGIGFLGAGVIFKDGTTVSGLTTASIIWMAAAVGMALGFGEFMLALGFLIATIVIVHGGNFINKIFFDIRVAKNLKIFIGHADIDNLQEITENISCYTRRLKEKNFQYDENGFTYTYDIFINKKRMPGLKEYLIKNQWIKRFEI